MPSDSVIGKTAPAESSLRIPQHLAVTMDGNGRWAGLRGQSRTEGHKAGISALRNLIELAVRYGIDYVTVFSFSSENWSRPKQEIDFIFGLLRRFVSSDLEKLIRNNVRIRVIGERDNLDSNLLKLIEKAENDTKDNSGMTLVVAFNYGGKAEIARAMRTLAQKVRAGELEPEDIGEDTIAGALYAPDIPAPDIVLRTSGEQRFSNFLIWQAAYSELVFIDAYWPDFDEETFVKVLTDYSQRERRFGAVEAQTP